MSQVENTIGQTSSKISFHWMNIAILCALPLFCLFFIVQPTSGWPSWLQSTLNYPSNIVTAWIRKCFDFVDTPLSTSLRNTIYLAIVVGLAPWLVMALFGHPQPSRLGLRCPNRFGWRLGIFGYIVSIPFLIWMVRSPGFAAPYLNQLDRAGAGAFGGYYLVNLVTEHFFLQGVVLALCRSSRCWPDANTSELDKDARQGSILRWFGFAQTTGGSSGPERIRFWFGLPEGCVLAIIVSGLLFGMIHLGKNPRELLLSVPGGLLQGYLAYRTNTWLVPLGLHIATAGTALGMIVMAR